MMGAEVNHPRHGEGDRAKRGGGGSLSLRRPTTYVARKLRRDLSLPEALLWNHLRASKLGVKFRRQHPIDPYVADFYSRAARLVIEIDGESHSRGDRPQKDIVRDQYLTSKGLRILRFTAADVLGNMDGVLASIRAEVDAPLHRFAVPLPASGEVL